MGEWVKLYILDKLHIEDCLATFQKLNFTDYLQNTPVRSFAIYSTWLRRCYSESASDSKIWRSSWQDPIVFTKASQSVVGPGAAIKYPHGWSDHVDYEAGERMHWFWYIKTMPLLVISLIIMTWICGCCNRASGDYWQTRTWDFQRRRF
jgi:hypothetical protein